MDVIILDVFLTLVCCSDVGLGVLDEITPSDTADIRGLSVPVGSASLANGLFGRFEIEHSSSLLLSIKEYTHGAFQ